MSEKLSQSDTFVLLADRRRRLSLRILRETTTPISLTELARRVDEREDEDPSHGDARRVQLALHHNHLPRLAAADVVGYDRDAGTVRPGVNFDDVVRALERVTDRDLPWSDG
jgi:predicted transcriptional regulator